MKKHKTILSEHQEDRELTRELFLSHIRSCVQSSVLELMESEVEGLCGPWYQPDKSSNCRRAGSDSGVLYLDGERHCVRRPRVRKAKVDGSEYEVQLHTYCRVRNLDNIAEEVIRLVAAGVSTRGAKTVRDKAPGKSTISRFWVEGSAEKLEQLRSRDLGTSTFFGLVIDGIFLTRELAVIVAVGLASDGTKSILDFAVGSSESYEVVKDLIVRIRSRGFKVNGRLFALLDGGKALHKGVLEFWPDALIQSCLVHIERQLHRHLRRQDHNECSRLMKRLRKGQGLTAGTEAARELYEFISQRNHQAKLFIENLGSTFLALHSLNVPSTLNISLLSTNLIENAIKNYRRQTKRVTRWRSKTNQADRWTAAALLSIESGFRRIKGYGELSSLIKELKKTAQPPIPTAPFRSCPLGTSSADEDDLHSTVGMVPTPGKQHIDKQSNKQELMESIR
jgi:putative transposase